jgi:hypothetical protein
VTTKPENNWVNEEMKKLELGDKRLEARNRKIISDFSQNPTASLPQFCGDRVASKGAYGYCQNKGVDRAGGGSPSASRL